MLFCFSVFSLYQQKTYCIPNIFKFCSRTFCNNQTNIIKISIPLKHSLNKDKTMFLTELAKHHYTVETICLASSKFMPSSW